MPAAEQVHESAARDAIGHYGRDLLNVSGLSIPDTIQGFANTIAILGYAHNASQMEDE
jgi:hypothetical protein